MTNYIDRGFWDGYSIIYWMTSKSNLLIKFCLIISLDEVIIGHINAGVLGKKPSCIKIYNVNHILFSAVASAITLYYSRVMNAWNVTEMHVENLQCSTFVVAEFGF